MLDTNKMIWDITEGGEWLDSNFVDEESGEVFFVELQREDGEEMEDFIAKCQEVADDNFDSAIFLGLVDGETAEMMGYDTY